LWIRRPPLRPPRQPVRAEQGDAISGNDGDLAGWYGQIEPFLLLQFAQIGRKLHG